MIQINISADTWYRQALHFLFETFISHYYCITFFSVCSFCASTVCSQLKWNNKTWKHLDVFIILQVQICMCLQTIHYIYHYYEGRALYKIHNEVLSKGKCIAMYWNVRSDHTQKQQNQQEDTFSRFAPTQETWQSHCQDSQQASTRAWTASPELTIVHISSIKQQIHFLLGRYNFRQLCMTLSLLNGNAEENFKWEMTRPPWKDTYLTALGRNFSHTRV